MLQRRTISHAIVCCVCACVFVSGCVCVSVCVCVCVCLCVIAWYVLQIFVQGLMLPDEPYVFFCREGIKMLLKLASPTQLVGCLPRLFDPIIAALSAEGNDDIVAGGMTIIQQLLLSDPEVAAALVPYYARFVPVFNKYKKKQSASLCLLQPICVVRCWLACSFVVRQSVHVDHQISME
jgi:hypothetical protein